MQKFIGEGTFVFDDRSAWSKHQPSAEVQNELIRLHGFDEYARWH
jgi:hypothetical protein